MFADPTIDEVQHVAAMLGIRLDRDDVGVYRRFISESLREFDRFVQERDIEARPPTTFPVRGPGHRPTRAEDPYNAWLWKCLIDGAPDGLLRDRTVSFKDHIPVAGLPLTFGAFALRHFVADFDATVVTRVLAAGGKIIGKNTTDGFVGGFGLGRNCGDFWPAINPHSRDHLTGGTSSGSAVAVVAGEVDVAFGGDQGGSIRIPAAWTGCVGLKPTFGLISHFGIGFGSDQTVDHIGPLARTVEDAARALQAVAGYDELDPRQRREVPDGCDVLANLHRGVRGMRIGLLREGFAGAEADVAATVRAAADVLADHGALVSEVSIPEHLRLAAPAAALWAEGSRAIRDTGLLGSNARTVYPPSVVTNVYRLWTQQADLLSPFTKLQYLVAEFSRRAFHGHVYAKAQNLRPTFTEAYDRCLAQVDLLLMPTCPQKAPLAPRRAETITLADLLDNPSGWLAVQNTWPFNYTGHPAIAMPCGRSAGLPVSMQLVGRNFGEAQLLRAACTYQHAVAYEDIIRVCARPITT